MATNWTSEGNRLFAFCRHGLLVEAEEGPGFVPYEEIEDTSYYDVSLLVERQTTVLRGGKANPEILPLKLRKAGTIELVLNSRDDGYSERSTIARLLEQRVRIYRAEERKRQLQRRRR